MKKTIVIISGVVVILLIVLALVRTGNGVADPIAQRQYAEAALIDARASARYDNAMASIMLVNGMLVPGAIALVVVALTAVLVYRMVFYSPPNPKAPIIYINGGSVEQLPTQQEAPFIIPVGDYAANHKDSALVD